MKMLRMISFLALIGITPLCFAGSRTLSEEIAADGVDRVVIDAKVGDIVVRSGEGETITLEVELKPRRGGIFSSLRRAEQEVRDATLEVTVKRRGAYLEVKSDNPDDRHFEEMWTVAMPPGLALEIEHGVGKIAVRGMAGGVEIEAGASDLEIEVAAGDVSLEVGVGDIQVKAPLANYESAACATGVGHAKLVVAGKTISSDGFVGDSASWSGNTGEYEIEVETNYGDIKVTLDR